MSHYGQDEDSPKYQQLLVQGSRQKITYKNVPQLVLRVVTLCISSSYFGYCLTYFSTFQNPELHFIGVNGEDPQTTTFHSILIGVIPVGAMIGALVAPLLMKAFTRKQFILLINLLAIIVEGIIQIQNVYVFLACRILQGLFIGNYMALVPVYINELAPKQIIGSFGVFTQLFVVVAVVISYGIGLIFQTTGVDSVVFYHLMVSIIGFFVIFQSIMLIINFVPESPNSLIAKNRYQQAKEVIGLFTLPQFVEQVFKEKQLQVNSQQSSKQNIKIQYSIKAYLLGFQLPFMQQLTGINAIVTSASSIVAGTISGLQNDVPLIINAVQLVATILTVFVLTRVGRRPLTLFGNLGLAIIDLAIGVLFVYEDEWKPSGMFIFALLIVYMFIYGISLGPVVWLYVPEIIPANVVPIATMMNWFGCSLCVIFTPIVTNLTGSSYPVFFFFGGITTLFFIFNFFFMIQTKGKNTEQIAKMFLKQN